MSTRFYDCSIEPAVRNLPEITSALEPHARVVVAGVIAIGLERLCSRFLQRGGIRNFAQNGVIGIETVEHVHSVDSRDPCGKCLVTPLVDVGQLVATSGNARPAPVLGILRKQAPVLEGREGLP